MIITVFPGQGAQTPGFLEPWLAVPGVRERLERYSADSGVDLIAAGTEWDADQIRDTQVAQPLIVAASLVSYAALTDAAASGASAAEAAQAAADAVTIGRDSTVPLVARKGRASYLGERSAGHLDPGAASSAILVQALADTLAGDAAGEGGDAA